MEKQIVVALSCPICGHHLVGFCNNDKNHSYISAYCPLCDEEFVFDEEWNIESDKK